MHRSSIQRLKAFSFPGKPSGQPSAGVVPPGPTLSASDHAGIAVFENEHLRSLRFAVTLGGNLHWIGLLINYLTRSQTSVSLVGLCGSASVVALWSLMLSPCFQNRVVSSSVLHRSTLIGFTLLLVFTILAQFGFEPKSNREWPHPHNLEPILTVMVAASGFLRACDLLVYYVLGYVFYLVAMCTLFVPTFDALWSELAWPTLILMNCLIAVFQKGEATVSVLLPLTLARTNPVVPFGTPGGPTDNKSDSVVRMTSPEFSNINAASIARLSSPDPLANSVGTFGPTATTSGGNRRLTGQGGAGGSVPQLPPYDSQTTTTSILPSPSNQNRTRSPATPTSGQRLLVSTPQSTSGTTTATTASTQATTAAAAAAAPGNPLVAGGVRTTTSSSSSDPPLTPSKSLGRKRTSLLMGILPISVMYQILDVLADLTDGLDVNNTLERMVNHVCGMLECDRATIYLIDNEANELWSKIAKASGEQFMREEIRIPMNSSIAGQCAQTQRFLNIDDPYNHEKFNREVDFKTGYTTYNMLVYPICHNGKAIAVLQAINKLRRHADGTPRSFTKNDEVILEVLCRHCATHLVNATQFEVLQKAEGKNRLLLGVAQELGRDVTVELMDILTKVMDHAKTALQCDRCTIFLRSEGEDQLICYAKSANEGEHAFNVSRIPMGSGIAGSVVATGRTINVKDAYDCSLFNPHFDQLTGYRTKSVLCVPILNTQG